MKIPFCGPAYQEKSLNINAQRCVNLYPVVTADPDGEETVVLYPTPGYQALTQFFDYEGDAPVTEMRGAIEINDQLYVVIGNTFQRITQFSTNVFVTNFLGTLLTGSGHVSIACNDTQIAISDDLTMYVYDIVSEVFDEMKDPDFLTLTEGNPLTNLTYQDGYFLAGVRNTRRTIQFDLLDGASIGASSFAEITSFPDFLKAVFSTASDLYVFGPKLAEVRYFDPSETPFSFPRHKGVLIEAGVAAWASIVKRGQTLVWLARDPLGRPYVAALNGYQADRLTTAPIEQAFESYPTVEDAFGFCYREAGSEFYVLTFPAGNATWVYDFGNGQWHERSRYPGGRDVPNCYAYWNGKHYVGTVDDEWIYEMSLAFPSFQGSGETVPIQRIRTASHLRAPDDQLMQLDEVEVLIETGVGIAGVVSDPQAILELSRDGGHTWTGVGQASIGAAGEYRKRLIWRKLGKGRSLTLRLTISDAVKVYIRGARAKVRVGSK